jgi:GNAT superfamily N-acetyltransferase
MLTLRQATIADIPLIYQFIQELADYEQLADAVTATPELLTMGLFGERATSEVVLAFIGEEPVGFALFFPNFSTFLGRAGLYLEDLYVRTPYRGQGIGKMLFGYLAQLAQTRGYGRVEWSVLDWNTAAIGFYERIGARPVSGWQVYRLTGTALAQLAQTT